MRRSELVSQMILEKNIGLGVTYVLAGMSLGSCLYIAGATAAVGLERESGLSTCLTFTGLADNTDNLQTQGLWTTIRHPETDGRCVDIVLVLNDDPIYSSVEVHFDESGKMSGIGTLHNGDQQPLISSGSKTQRPPTPN